MGTVEEANGAKELDSAKEVRVVGIGSGDLRLSSFASCSVARAQRLSGDIRSTLSISVQCA